VSFKDTDSHGVMVHAIRAIIRMIQGFNLHRIDFRCVGGNPAERGYSGILQHFLDEYDIQIVAFRDNIKDRQGNYHDTIMYELIRRADR
jgi:RimJ/RimL family protein N-acetyltransferase